MVKNKVDTFLENELINKRLQEKMNSCKTTKERIEFLNSIRPNMKPWDQAMIDRHPNWISSVYVA